MAKKAGKKKSGKATVSVTLPNGEQSKPITLDELKERTDAIVNSQWKPPQLISTDIRKAKITKDKTLHVEYMENYDDLTHSTIVKDCDQLVHPDLENAFHHLTPHLVILCDQKGDSEATNLMHLERAIDEMDLPDYAVTGFSISGEGEKEGVVLIGRKKMEKKVLNLLSPYEPLESDYEHSIELIDAIEKCKREVQLYLNGKAAVKQAALDFEGEEIQDVPFEDDAKEEQEA